MIIVKRYQVTFMRQGDEVNNYVNVQICVLNMNFIINPLQGALSYGDFVSCSHSVQWWIQDSQGGANIIFGQFFPKIARKWRNFGPEGPCIPHGPQICKCRVCVMLFCVVESEEEWWCHLFSHFPKSPSPISVHTPAITLIPGLNLVNLFCCLMRARKAISAAPLRDTFFCGIWMFWYLNPPI